MYRNDQMPPYTLSERRLGRRIAWSMWLGAASLALGLATWAGRADLLR